MNLEKLDNLVTFGEQRGKINAAFTATEGAGVLPVIADGATDQSGVIQDEIDRLAGLGGGVITLPLGVIAIDTTLVINSSNIRLVGQGGDWNHDTGSQGAQAGTTLKWIGSEFDGNAVYSGTIDSVTENGNRLNDAGASFTDYEHQGLLVVDHFNDCDLIMDSGPTWWEVKPTSTISWSGQTGIRFFKPSVMVEVKTEASPNGQKHVGSGVEDIYFDSRTAHIGLRIIAHNSGTFKNLGFWEPMTAGIYMGSLNPNSTIPATGESDDPQFNIFENIVSRSFDTINNSGLFVCTGVSGIGGGSNTSFNKFTNMVAQIKNGDGYVFGSSDENQFDRCVSVLAGGGTGHGILFLGSNRGDTTVARNNMFNGYTGANAPITTYGTDEYQYVARKNFFMRLDQSNNTPLPTAGTGASVFYDTDDNNSANRGLVQNVAGETKASVDAGRDQQTPSESMRIVNNSSNHLRLDNQSGLSSWSIAVDGAEDGDLNFARAGGQTGLMKFTAITNINATAGASTALPATPEKYLRVKVGTTEYRIPLYNT
jgi:hypothetical protein